MWKQELIKNKIYAALLIVSGTVSVWVLRDVTFFIFALLVGIPLFFAKKNWIM